MKKHHCKVPGCGKSFSRPSHLQRHALNHSDTQWICERCTMSFKRSDLLERHKARHSSKDRNAGGPGLGILKTKKKFINRAENRAEITSRLAASTTQSPHTSNSSHTNEATPYHDGNDRVASVSDRGNIPEDVATMYHDMTFDLVHFNVMGFTPQRSAVHSPADTADVGLPASILRSAPYPRDGEPENHRDSHDAPSISPLVVDSNGEQFPGQPQPMELNGSVVAQENRHASIFSLPNALSQPENGHTLQENLESRHSHQYLSTDDLSWGESRSHSSYFHPPISGRKQLSVSMPAEKRSELIEFIDEIGPLRPDGSIIDGDSPDLSLQKMQIYLNLFLEYFNTSYPLLHVPTIDIRTLDAIALLSFIILGATYRNKDDHQLSVCLYDAIIPYIFSSLLSNPVPELATLQAFMVLECYGMYRAGPYQRENAILIHSLLLNSIRRASRYHVRACITLPGHLTHAEKDWVEFAYAEQYKRLILFFFMWDTQNTVCYSFMPNISTQSLHLVLPCTWELWEARNETEWMELSKEHNESVTFRTLVDEFVNSTYHTKSKPHDMLGFSLALHGLMSMCNEIILFDSRSSYFTMLKTKESIWSAGREQMAYALSSWKAEYDAFALTTLQTMEPGPIRNQFQRDETGLYALYHTAHIVLNCEIRHLQTAAGAKAIFGHLVTPIDFEDSYKWVREWVRSSADSAGRAAWHAAQLFREGVLNLKNWDVHGVFHYPWCLYIGALTCWAFHHFGSELSANCACDHSTPAKADELRKTSRASMNHIVATMTSVTPAYMTVLMGKCCTHGLAIEMAKYLQSVRWTAAYEAMKVLEGLSGLPTDTMPMSI